MGTRSLTFVYDDEKSKPILCMYRQFDGYPSGHGQELVNFLAPFTVVNGYGMDMKAGTHANGMGCLAAQLIAHFKTEIGGFYIEPADTPEDGMGAEYAYHVYPDRLVVRDSVYDRVSTKSTPRTIFDQPRSALTVTKKTTKIIDLEKVINKEFPNE